MGDKCQHKWLANTSLCVYKEPLPLTSSSHTMDLIWKRSPTNTYWTQCQARPLNPWPHCQRGKVLLRFDSYMSISKDLLVSSSLKVCCVSLILANGQQSASYMSCRFKGGPVLLEQDFIKVRLLTLILVLIRIKSTFWRSWDIQMHQIMNQYSMIQLIQSVCSTLIK